MGGDNRELPPYRIISHFQAAFGGVFGTLNLFVGAVSIARQLAHAFHVGLSPVLKNIFVSYVQIFHGLVDFFAAGLSWLSGFDLHVPAWAHDWIILWFVMAGAASRLILASVRGLYASPSPYEIEMVSVTKPPGILGFLSQIVISVYTSLWSIPLVARAAQVMIAYILATLLWPIILVQVMFVSPQLAPLPLHTVSVDPSEYTRISYLVIFLLQTIAIILGIFGLSVLNVQTM